jgi:CHAT domain-containing protein
MTQRLPQPVTLEARLPALGALQQLAPVTEAVLEVSSPSSARSLVHLRSYDGKSLAERGVRGAAPRAMALARDERWVALAQRIGQRGGSRVRIISLHDQRPAVTVVLPRQVDDIAWLGSSELLVVGRAGGSPWARRVHANGEVVSLRLECADRIECADRLQRVSCGRNGAIAVVSIEGSSAYDLRHVVELHCVQSRAHPSAAFRDRLSLPMRVPGPALSRDGRHLLLGDMLGSATAVRLPGRAGRTTEGVETLVADGPCVVGQRVIGTTVSAWRSTSEDLAPWAEWEPEAGQRIADLDVLERGATADVLVCTQPNDQILVFRLGDPDLLNLASDRPDRRRRAVRALAERREPAAVEPLTALLVSDAPADRVAAAEALVAIGGEGLAAVVAAHTELDPLTPALLDVPAGELAAAVRRSWERGAEGRRSAVTLLRDRVDLDGTDVLLAALRGTDPALRALGAEAIGMRAVPEAVVDLVAAAADANAEVAGAARRALRRTLGALGQVPRDAPDDLLAAAEPGVQAVLVAGGPAAEEAPILFALADLIVLADRPGADVLNALDALADTDHHRPMALALALVLAERLLERDRGLAARLLERAIELAATTDLDVPAVRWRAQLARARLAARSPGARGERAARTWLRAALTTVDGAWSQLLGDPSDAHFFAEKSDLYEEALLNELRLGHAAAALDVLERAKTRYLVDLIARRHDPRVRTLEPLEELFWQVVGAPRPTAGGPAVTRAAAAGPQLATVAAATRPSADALLPEKLAALRAAPNAMGVGMLDELWLLIAMLPGESAEKLARATGVLEEVDATLEKALALAHGDRSIDPADVRGRYLGRARALLEIDESFWVLDEYGERWLAAFLDDPAGPEQHTLAAVREAIAHLTGRAPVVLVVPPSDAEEPADTGNHRPTPAFTPLPPGSRASSTPAAAPAVDAGRLALTSRTRWEEIERFARGETAGFREVAERLLDEPGLGLVQFAVTQSGTAVFVAARGAALGARPLPELAGWAGPAVFTSREITAERLAVALSGSHEEGGWMPAYRRRDESQERWERVTDALLELLYGELFAPVRDWLRARSVHRLLVVPHRGLHQLPLGAWFAPVGRGRRRYVVDEFEVCTTASLSLHDVCARRAPDPARTVDRVLVVAPPGRRLALTGVDALALPDDATILRGERASVEGWSAAAGDADLCHYQGHAAYSWEQPLDSALDLTRGALTLGALFDDAVELPHVHAVTLSGCETTMTALDPADEWLGLAAGFMFAGAPAVLSTHWAVHELAASMLVERYYRELRAGRRPSAALATAQRWLRKDVTHRTCRAFARRVSERMSETERELVDHLLDELPETGRSRRFGHPFAAPVYWGAHTVAGLDRPLRMPSRTAT